MATLKPLILGKPDSSILIGLQLARIDSFSVWVLYASNSYRETKISTCSKEKAIFLELGTHAIFDTQQCYLFISCRDKTEKLRLYRQNKTPAMRPCIEIFQGSELIFAKLCWPVSHAVIAL